MFRRIQSSLLEPVGAVPDALNDLQCEVDHVVKGSLPLFRIASLAGHYAVTHGKYRQGLYTVLGRQGVQGAALHVHGEYAVFGPRFPSFLIIGLKTVDRQDAPYVGTGVHDPSPLPRRRQELEVR